VWQSVAGGWAPSRREGQGVPLLTSAAMTGYNHRKDVHPASSPPDRSFFRPAMPPGKIPQRFQPVVQACQERLGYEFKNPALLYAALTHASGTDHRLNSNERLEFLGDAILGFVTCELLFNRYPEFLEGALTQIKSSVVSRTTCGRIGLRIGLPEFLLTGKGMDLKRGLPRSLVANAFESVIAAIFLDGGIDAAREFLTGHLTEEIESIVEGNLQLNFKSSLQHIAQRDFGQPPSYHVLDEQGPDHHKSFQICAQIGPRRFAPAWGNNKKQAEQRAASNALAELEGQAPPYDGQPVPQHG
jgi:ribonuclease-3